MMSLKTAEKKTSVSRKYGIKKNENKYLIFRLAKGTTSLLFSYNGKQDENVNVSI